MTFLLPMMASTFLACALPADEKSALERDPQGWTDLLVISGPELKGWTRGPIPPTAKLSEESPWSYDAKTGILNCAGDKSGHEWLRWDQERGDGIFHVEFRFAPVPGFEPGPGKKSYNSGVFVRSSADGKIWYQAQAGAASGGFIFGDKPEGDGVKRIFAAAPKTNPVKPAGEWNTFEFTAKGKDLSLWVNGVPSAQWHECPSPRGYIGLEAEGWRIAFKNVKYKPLPEH